MITTTLESSFVQATATRGRVLARWWLLAVTLLLAVAPVHAQWVNNQAAVNVIGQPDFMSASFQVDADSLSFATGVAVDPTTGKVFVADSNIVRVTRYSSMAAMLNGQPAEAVLGQPDLMSSGVAATQNGMNQPNGICVDAAGRLWVAERGNNRVTRFDNAATKPNGANADGVLGQPDFMTNTAGTSATKMSGPLSVFVDGAGRLWVSDRSNIRVLRFDNAAMKANGAAADGVLGQSDFMTNTGGTSATKLQLPEYLFVDGAGRLWVVDSLNHRVLRFDNAAMKANGAAADGVLGRPDLMSGGFGTTQNTMHTPSGVFGDPDGRLYVAESGNHRVLIFNNAAAKANGANADNVLGQPDFNSGTANNGGRSATSFNLPSQVWFDPATYSLYVAELSNRRVKRYALPCPTVLAPTSQSFAASGGTGSVTITLPGACPWSAVNNTPSLITITSASSGMGNGMLTYSVGMNSAPTPRSGTISINGVTFTVLQGAMFDDVPIGHPFYEFIGKLSARGITLGCDSNNYCPDSNVTREQMAIFVERALGTFTPPAGPLVPTFADVPNAGATDYSYEFIEDLTARGITLGCATGPPRLYCPSAAVTREQAAIVILRALGVFTPPPGPVTPTFADVPNSGATDYGYEFIEEFAARGFTLGCTAGPPRLYCPTAAMTRGQMAAFLVRAFNL
jgi:sugar lactone lactonase YvrE